MATIPLTRGLVAIIDDADEADLSRYRWHAANLNGYVYAARTTKEHKAETMHRRLMAFPSALEVDHVNGDTLDNRRSNLRLATHSQQQMNNRKHRDVTTSRFKGVSWDKDRSRWTAHITAGGRHLRLGRFHDEAAAADAYDAAARLHFGAFARTNS